MTRTGSPTSGGGSAALAPLHAVVPLRGLVTGKARLGEAIDAEERAQLVLGLLRRTLRILRDWQPLTATYVVTSDRTAQRVAAEFGARVVTDPGTGLNAAIREGTEAARERWSGGGIDPSRRPSAPVGRLPRPAPGRGGRGARRGIRAAARRHLAVRRAQRHERAAALPSRRDQAELRHRAASRHTSGRPRDAGTSLQVVPDPGLGFDLDTPEDFERLPAAVIGELLELGRARARADGGPVSDGGRLLAVALPELPEVQPGDDLGGLIADALRSRSREDASLSRRAADVLVVTQKIVSKAEGRSSTCDVEPRPAAIEFAERWERDARQIEVVLRESAEVVRMERGVLIAGRTTASSAPMPASTPRMPDRRDRDAPAGGPRPVGSRDPRAACE